MNVDEPYRIVCGLCGEVVYSTTPPAYSDQAVRRAVEEHDAQCPARKARAEGHLEHELIAHQRQAT